MTDSVDVEFRRLLEKVGSKLSNVQTRGIARIYGIPNRLFGNGIELLLILHGQRKISFENVENFREDLVKSGVGAESLALMDQFVSSLGGKRRPGDSIEEGEGKAPPQNDVGQGSASEGDQGSERKAPEVDILEWRDIHERIEEKCPPIKWLLLVFSEYELRSLLTVFSSGEEIQKIILPSENQQPSDDNVKSAEGVCWIFPVIEAAIVCCDQGDPGAGEAYDILKEAIPVLKPSYVVNVGVAWGIGGKQQLGDILVSYRVDMFDFERSSEDGGIEQRGSGYQTGAALYNIFKDGKAGFKARSSDAIEDIAIHSGPLLSGLQLVDSLDVKAKLLNDHPKAIGGDMDGEKVRDICNNTKIQWIAIKGICDWTDGNKQKEWHPFATAMSAQFVLHVIKRRREATSVISKKGQAMMSNNPILHSTFIGRNRLADELLNSVKPPVKKVDTQYFALVSDAGAGKTQMAIWFSKRMRERNLFNVMWFMSGETQERFSKDLDDLMISLGIELGRLPPKKLRKLFTKKMNEKGKWLLVVDNLDLVSLAELKERIPDKGGVVLLTSKDRSVLPVNNVMKVEPFSDEEAMALFEKILGKGEVNEALVTKAGELFGYNAFSLSKCARKLRTFSEMEMKEQVPFPVTKIILLGDSGSGKTHTVKRLTAEEYVEESDRFTEALEVGSVNLMTWERDEHIHSDELGFNPLRLKKMAHEQRSKEDAEGDGDRSIVADIYDFGGIEVYRHVSHFFMGDWAVYLVFLNLEEELRLLKEQLSYYVSVVKTFAPEARIMVIGTRFGTISSSREEVEKMVEEVKEEQAKESLVKVFFIENSEGESESEGEYEREELKTMLFVIVQRMMREKESTIPLLWARMLDKLRWKREEEELQLVSKSEELCEIELGSAYEDEDKMMKNPIIVKLPLGDVKAFSQRMKEMGLLFYFEAPEAPEELTGSVVLDPRWLVEGMKGLLTFEGATRVNEEIALDTTSSQLTQWREFLRSGVLSSQLLELIASVYWKGNEVGDEKVSAYFMNVLQQLSLLYKLSDGNEGEKYLVPPLLPKEKTREDEKLIGSLSDMFSVRMKRCYPPLELYKLSFGLVKRRGWAYDERSTRHSIVLRKEFDQDTLINISCDTEPETGGMRQELSISILEEHAQSSFIQDVMDDLLSASADHFDIFVKCPECTSAGGDVGLIKLEDLRAEGAAECRRCSRRTSFNAIFVPSVPLPESESEAESEAESEPEPEPEEKAQPKEKTASLPLGNSIFPSGFVERSEIAARLLEKVKPTSSPPQAQPSVAQEEATEYFALVGEGGSGKTHLSLYFCEQMKEKKHYDLVWVVSGDGLEKFNEGLKELKEELTGEGGEVPTSELRAALSKALKPLSGRWLIVVDQLEGIALEDVQERIPEQGGTVLLTSRDSGVLPPEKIVEVTALTDEEAMRLFEIVLGEDAQIDESLIHEVGILLGNNAFALSVCAYYLLDESIQPDEVDKEEIEERLHELVTETKHAERGETVQAMYERSLLKLETESPAAWKLLCKITMLHPAGITLNIVRGIEKDHATCEREYERVGLKLAQIKGKYSVHRLLKAVVQERMELCSDEFTSGVFHELVEDLWSMWTWSSGDNHRWRKKQEMGEHVETLAVHMTPAAARRLRLEEGVEKCRDQLVAMLQNFSWYTIGVKAKLDSAEEIIRRAEQVEAGGKCSLEVRTSLLNVRGKLRKSQGKYEEAVALYREGLELAPDSQKYMWHNNVGICLKKMKNYGEALEEFEKALSLHQAQDKADMHDKQASITVSNTLMNMGSCLSHLKKFDEAIDKLDSALQICIAKYGEFSPLAANCYVNISAALTRQKQKQKRGKPSKRMEALKMDEKALEIYRQVYGEGVDHPNVASTLQNVGIDKRGLGQEEEARPFLEEAYRMRVRLLGEDHPDTIKSKSVLDKK